MENTLDRRGSEGADTSSSTTYPKFINDELATKSAMSAIGFDPNGDQHSQPSMFAIKEIRNEMKTKSVTVTTITLQGYTENYHVPRKTGNTF